MTDAVRRGGVLYATTCATCHGASLVEGEFAPPLDGRAFIDHWKAPDSLGLREVITRRMPPAAPGSLSADQVTDLLAFIWYKNGQSVPGRTVFTDPAEAVARSLSASPLVSSPADSRALRAYRPVTDAEQRAPRDGDWLSWRRTPDGQAFSPLRAISRSNVAGLQLGWSWTLPGGAAEATPLVHDGILFVRGSGDVVEALDGATGTLLWHYARTLPAGTVPNLAKAIALSGDQVIVTTSDLHVVALEARTGAVAWDVPIAAPGAGHSLNGGPLVARGKIIIGTGGQKPGGNVIVALDAVTGRELWRFATIDLGDSWNGVPVDKRSGGAIWTPGSFDPELGLVYFGPSATYDTAPLREARGHGSNEALYTNNTLALDVDTGKLVWRYNHLPNDQWDLDWAFERQLFDLVQAGTKRRMVVTGGKLAIFDLLDAHSGAYVSSIDAGLQDLVSRIDPVTGAKKIDPARVPGDGTAKPICPSSSGGKNWYPGAIDPRTTRLFMPLNETCMDLVPTPAGTRGLLSTGVTIALRPRPGSDGMLGRLEAFDLATHRPVWAQRRRAPVTTGVLSTAGDLVFAGFFDRQFIAYDSRSGAPLWRARLNDTPSGSPITYIADGRQFVAIVAGNSGLLESQFAKLLPENRAPLGRSTTLWVFALGDHRGGASIDE